VSVCVCGHKATDHKSVETTATRFQESCHCGCTVYEEWQTE